MRAAIHGQAAVRVRRCICTAAAASRALQLKGAWQHRISHLFVAPITAPRNSGMTNSIPRRGWSRVPAGYCQGS